MPRVETPAGLMEGVTALPRDLKDLENVRLHPAEHTAYDEAFDWLKIHRSLSQQPLAVMVYHWTKDDRDHAPHTVGVLPISLGVRNGLARLATHIAGPNRVLTPFYGNITVGRLAITDRLVDRPDDELIMATALHTATSRPIGRDFGKQAGVILGPEPSEVDRQIYESLDVELTTTSLMSAWDISEAMKHYVQFRRDLESD